MKASLATLVSIVSVAATSGAAYSFNTVILSTPAKVASVTQTYVPTSQAATAPQDNAALGAGAVLQASVDNASGTVDPEIAVSSVSAEPAAPSAAASADSGQVQEASYDLGRLGIVAVRESGGVVSVTSVSSQWRVATTMQGGKVSLRFSNAAEEYIFTVSSTLGALTTTLSATPPASSTTSPSTRPRSTEHEDDEDEDERDGHYEDEERDD